MKSTKIIFFGTSDRSLPILESLKSNFNLALCVTKKDSKIGRKQTLKETEVKRWCKEENVDYIEVDSLKNENLEYVLARISTANPDLGVVADFSYIVPKKIIGSIKGGLINIHFSLLPKYRGASPVQFALLNGDDITGVTYYLLDEKMDTGDILSQIEYKIYSDTTSGGLYTELFKIAAQNLPNIISDYLNKNILPAPQDNSKATYTFSKTNPAHTFIFKEDALIDWDVDALKIDRMIKAFHPWPVAWSYLHELEKAKCFNKEIRLKDYIDKNLKVKIFKSHILDDKLFIDEIQVEGKNKITWNEFRNGYLEEIN